MHSVYLLFIMFASTFKRTHRLVPGYLIGQVRISRGYYNGVHAEPRIAATRDKNYPGQLFLWKWSPIDVGEPRAAFVILTRNHCCIIRPLWSCIQFL